MSELLSSITGSGGDFITRALGGGSTGTIGLVDLVTITPPSGQRVRVTHLSTENTTTRSNITLLFGTTEILSNKSITGPQPTGASQYSIGSYFPYSYAGTQPPQGNYVSVTGKADEVFIIRSESAVAAGALYYNYEFGE